MNKKLIGEEPIISNDKFGYGIGRMVVDSWSYDNPLGELVIKAENEFVKAIKSK